MCGGSTLDKFSREYWHLMGIFEKGYRFLFPPSGGKFPPDGGKVVVFAYRRRPLYFYRLSVDSRHSRFIRRWWVYTRLQPNIIQNTTTISFLLRWKFWVAEILRFARHYQLPPCRGRNRPFDLQIAAAKKGFSWERDRWDYQFHNVLNSDDPHRSVFFEIFGGTLWICRERQKFSSCRIQINFLLNLTYIQEWCRYTVGCEATGLFVLDAGIKVRRGSVCRLRRNPDNLYDREPFAVS